MPKIDDVDERLRKIEHTFSFLKGIIAVSSVVILAYFSVNSYYLIPKKIDKIANKELGEETRATIKKALSEANSFLDHPAHEIWPSGSYAILKNGKCPKNFRSVSGFAKALKIYARKQSYLKEAKFGDSRIEWTGPESNGANVDFHLSVCVKDS